MELPLRCFHFALSVADIDTWIPLLFKLSFGLDRLDNKLTLLVLSLLSSKHTVQIRSCWSGVIYVLIYTHIETLSPFVFVFVPFQFIRLLSIYCLILEVVF